jgi:peroxiredoxin Q/BCP
MKLPEVGQPAPDFEGIADNGEKISLSDFKGMEFVLYFYPRADTPGCTKEACSFRDDYSAYEEAGIAIIGVSPDTVKKQAKFKNKWDLPFPLIADEEHNIADAYGVWGPKKFMGREYEGVHRTTFIIDKQGKIKQVFENVKPAEHSKEILAAVGA